MHSVNHLKYILLAVASILIIRGNAQKPFQQVLDAESWATSLVPYNIIEGIDGGIYVISTTGGGMILSDLRLSKINSMGMVEWDTTFSFTPGNEFFPKMIPAHGGGVILGSVSTSYPEPDQDGEQDMLIWKVSPSAEIEWQTVLPARYFSNLCQTKDNNYIIVGNSFDSGQDLLVYKIDVNGNIVWTKNLGESGSEWEDAVFVSEIDEHIYVSGKQYKVGTDGSDGILYKLDMDGNHIWTIKRERFTPTAKTNLTTVFKFDNKYFFRAGDYYRFDPIKGNFWSVSDSIDFIPYFFSKRCNSNALFAMQWDASMEVNVLKKYNSLISPEFEHPISDIVGVVKDVVSTKDGGFAVLTEHLFASEDFQVTKVDCQGNVDFWNNQCLPKTDNDNKIFLYPNPSQFLLNIEANFDFNSIEIYSVLGTKIEVKNICECNQLETDISFLSSGIYVLKVVGSDQSETIKFIKT